MSTYLFHTWKVIESPTSAPTPRGPYAIATQTSPTDEATHYPTTASVTASIDHGNDSPRDNMRRVSEVKSDLREVARGLQRLQPDGQPLPTGEATPNAARVCDPPESSPIYSNGD